MSTYVSSVAASRVSSCYKYESGVHKYGFLKLRGDLETEKVADYCKKTSKRQQLLLSYTFCGAAWGLDSDKKITGFYRQKLLSALSFMGGTNK